MQLCGERLPPVHAREESEASAGLIPEIIAFEHDVVLLVSADNVLQGIE